MNQLARQEALTLMMDQLIGNWRTVGGSDSNFESSKTSSSTLVMDPVADPAKANWTRDCMRIDRTFFWKFLVVDDAIWLPRHKAYSSRFILVTST